MGKKESKKQDYNKAKVGYKLSNPKEHEQTPTLPMSSSGYDVADLTINELEGSRGSDPKVVVKVVITLMPNMIRYGLRNHLAKQRGGGRG